MTMIIGLTGFAGSGKDSVAALLAERFGAGRVAFADALKDELAAAFGVERRLFDDPKAKDTPAASLALRNCTESAFAVKHWHLAHADALKPRTLMTSWGDWRRGTDPLYFVLRAAERLDALTAQGATAIVLTDVRYLNERALVHVRGGALWRVSRPGLQPCGGHASEWELAGSPVDAHIINGGSIEQLEKIATDLYLELRERRAA